MNTELNETTMKETEQFAAKCITGGYKPTSEELQKHSANLRSLVARTENISEKEVDRYLRNKSRVRLSGQRRTKVGRNDPCPCGSGMKYKHCHLK